MIDKTTLPVTTATTFLLLAFARALQIPPLQADTSTTDQLHLAKDCYQFTSSNSHLV